MLQTAGFPLIKEAPLVSRVSRGLDRVEVIFDDENAVDSAGLLLTATLADRLGLEAAADELVRIPNADGGFRPGRKILTLVHSMIRGGSFIDDANALRAGDVAGVLGHRVMAPSTLGTFLRGFSFGHLRQFDRLTETALTRAWAAGAGPDPDEQLIVDIDSTICATFGDAKEGTGIGYTKDDGYHPLVATRAETGEVLHARMRTGSANSARGAVRFTQELLGRTQRAGHAGQVLLRADQAFYNHRLCALLEDRGHEFSIGVRQTAPVAAAIANIDEHDWVDIGYTPNGQAQVAETTHWGWRLVVRRTRLNSGNQRVLFDTWDHHAFLTNTPLEEADTVAVDARHRHHAVVELAIRDLKEGAGLEHCPSGNFCANGAWLLCATLAHNLIRWLARIGLRIAGPVVAKTIRNRYLRMPGRLVHPQGRPRLRLPARWPWRHSFTRALQFLRACPALH